MHQYNNQNYKYQLKIIKINKFALHAFNYSIYIYEISRILAVNIFLNFSKYYISKKLLK